MGHDPDNFRIDSAPHPFSVPHSPGDVRFTTRYDEDYLPFSVNATLHEAGHAMYEAGLPRQFAFRPGGEARGMTVHESQSLSLEKVAGRSREFLSYLAPMMAEGPSAATRPSGPCPMCSTTGARVVDGYIRVEADELSYPLHVILRYRLEQAMLKGDLVVDDIPGAWDEMFSKLFGRTPPDLAHGCLQDIHWAAGMVGYFPNYAMGSMLATQLFERALVDDPAILPAIGQRRLRSLLGLGPPAGASARQPGRFRHPGEGRNRRGPVQRAYKRHVAAAVSGRGSAVKRRTGTVYRAVGFRGLFAPGRRVGCGFVHR